MLKFLMKMLYKDRIYTDEPELFYKLYKWDVGLYSFISLRRIFEAITFEIIAFINYFFIKSIIYSLVFICISGLFLLVELIRIKNTISLKVSGIKTPFEVQSDKIYELIKKYITLNGKALGRKEWRAIKKHDVGLYHDLLCDECNHCCYYYSLEIARVIKDVTLIWGGVEEPFKDGHKFYAHAIILKNGYIYDSNLRHSVKYEDFVKLYKFKIYKEWQYEEYSKKDFREIEREKFREWCEKNNILAYEKF